jgi:hypothetical protein
MLKKISKPIENISKRKLSIQFSLGGFSFCISNFEHTIFHFSSYTFEEETSTPELLLKRIEDVFQTDKDLHDDFESVVVIHENHLNSFVPNAYFKEEALKSYLDYNIKTISTDYIAYDDLEGLGIKNVYVPYVNINNFLFQNFGEFEYKHHATVLVEKLIKKTQTNDVTIYANVSENTLDMVVIENQQLVFYNGFEYDTKEDFIYYILFTFEQLKVDPAEASLHLLGAIDKDSELYTIAYTYIQTLEFSSTSSPILDSEDIENHSNFILLA